MDQNTQKQLVAEAAIAYIPEGSIVGVGTGSTVNFFIAALAKVKGRIRGAVSSSVASAKLLSDAGISVMDLNHSGDLDVYIDGADEITEHLHMIKGGGGALTRDLAGARAEIEEAGGIVSCADAALAEEVFGAERFNELAAFVSDGGESLCGFGDRAVSFLVFEFGCECVFTLT